MLGDVEGDRAVWQYSLDMPVLVRVKSNDIEKDGLWAWQFEKPCDDDCHHPVHAFNAPKGAHHFEWFKPGSSALIPVPTTP